MQEKKAMTNTTQNLKGFRDFLPSEKRQRDWVAAKIKTVFERFGFEPLETPTLEYASLLLGKYGKEADKLVYTFEDRGGREVGLRYDQTVPTARVLGQYSNQLPKYFRRYQIQNVFRADKPQAGRFREFTQCDCDIFGSTSTVADAEILAVFYSVYAELGLDSLVIELNDRQTLLATLSPFVTPNVDVFSIIQSIDKLDKLSAAEVATELMAKGLTSQQANDCIGELDNVAISENLKEIEDRAIALGIPAKNLKINPSLARGLDYYTGMIFEGKLPEYGVGSIGGGGRYDSLLGDLTGLQMPAVGFGIGFDRTVEATLAQGKIPTNPTTQVLVTLFDDSDESIQAALTTAQALRSAQIATEIVPAPDKLAKQFKLANQKQIPFVVVVGENERAENKIQLKNMANGIQALYSIQEAVKIIKDA